MTANPIDLVGGLATTANVIKADLTSWAKARVPQVLADAAEIRHTTLANQLVVILKSTGVAWFLDAADTTSPDDGTSCIISSDGKRFKPLASNSAVGGPASSTDGHVALFNGTTGKLIKDSGKA